MTPTGLPARAYQVVKADPPWPWQARTPRGHGKSPEAHYRTMPMDEIADLRLGDLVAPGGVMLLWATWPELDQQIAMLSRWGLTYVTGLAWAKRTRSGKSRWGPGYIARSLCEPILLARTPGRLQWCGASFPNLIEELEGELVDGVAREHSRKPDELYRRVEQASPGARRADIFVRQRRPGWEPWGDQIDHFRGAA
jgi:N6-adenosine-specific RNA methylase IME4